MTMLVARKATKEYKCAKCGETIAKGSAYIRYIATPAKQYHPEHAPEAKTPRAKTETKAPEAVAPEAAPEAEAPAPPAPVAAGARDPMGRFIKRA